MNLSVTIPPVRTFAHVEADKAQALKPLEEAAEVFAAWQARMAAHERHYDVVSAGVDLVNECCDVIMATCNLLAAIGVTDLTEAMAACEERNRERGRYE